MICSIKEKCWDREKNKQDEPSSILAVVLLFLSGFANCNVIDDDEFGDKQHLSIASAMKNQERTKPNKVFF